MRDFAAQAAADAAFDHGRHRIGAQRIGVGLDGERRAAGQPDAGMVAGADFIVDAKARLHHALAALELVGIRGADAALPRQHAFAIGDDDLEPMLGRAHGFLQRLHHFGHAVGVHGAQPSDAERAQSLFNGDAGRRAAAVRRARRQILLTGGRGVAVLHHDQHAVALVEHVRGDAGDQAVVPKTAVAHDRDRAVCHVRADGSGAGERHAVAEDRIAERERRKGRERMAADVGRDMGRADLALDELDGGKHRPLRTTGAEIRRPRRDVAGIGHGRRLVREKFFRALGNRIGIDAGWTRLGEERGDAAQQRLGIVITGARQTAFAENARRYVDATQDHIDLLLDIFGRALLDHQHGALADAEVLHFLGNERIGDVEHIDRNAAAAVEIGEIEPRQRTQ